MRTQSTLMIVLLFSLCTLAAQLLLLPASSASAQQNPLFFGEWEAGFPEEEQLRHKIIEPGRIYVERDGEIISDLRYRVVRDFGTHIVIVTEWEVDPYDGIDGPVSKENVLPDFSVMYLDILDSGNKLISWDRCGSHKVASFMLGDIPLEDRDMDETWARIRAWSDDPDTSYVQDLLGYKHQCRIRKNGIPWGRLENFNRDPEWDYGKYPIGRGWGRLSLFQDADK